MTPEAAYWQETIEKEIPLSRALDFRLIEVDAAHCISMASLSANINIHGTAFAGSLYALSTLTAWTYLNNYLMHNNLQAQVVLAEGNIRYLRPVTNDIQCECRPDDQVGLDGLAAKVNAAKRGKILLKVTIYCENKTAVVFSGTFAAIPN